jgi:hypothetical protein
MPKLGKTCVRRLPLWTRMANPFIISSTSLFAVPPTQSPKTLRPWRRTLQTHASADSGFDNPSGKSNAKLTLKDKGTAIEFSKEADYETTD